MQIINTNNKYKVQVLFSNTIFVKKYIRVLNVAEGEKTSAGSTMEMKI